MRRADILPWQLPLPPVPTFAGRKDLLAEIELLLGAESPVVLVQPQGGLGGVGKTTLALEYILERRDRYPVVCWFDGSDRISLSSRIAALADRLGLVDATCKTFHTRIQKTVEWLNSRRDWIFVVENVDDPAMLAPSLASPQMGDVIITSSTPFWEGIAAPITVGALRRDESVDLLIARGSTLDRGLASEVAESVGDLPLTLTLAGGASRELGGLAQWLKLYRQRHQEIWGEEPERGDTLRRVTSATSLSFEILSRSWPEGLVVLAWCSWLAPECMPAPLITRLAGCAGAGRELGVPVTQLLARLSELGLLTADEQFVTIHPLVQAMVRGHLEDDERSRTASELMNCMSSSLPLDVEDPATWPSLADWTPHVLSIVNHTETVPELAGRRVELLMKLGAFQTAWRYLDGARVLLDRAHSLAQEQLQVGDPVVGPLLGQLGQLQQLSGDLYGSWDFWERAAVSYEVSHGTGSTAAQSAREQILGLMRSLQKDIKLAQKKGIPVHALNPRRP